MPINCQMFNHKYTTNFLSVCFVCISMALRTSMSYLKPSISRVCGNISNFTTSTTSTMIHDKGSKTRIKKADIVPLYMAVGMIGLSVSFGIYTAKQQLRHSPNVYVKKSRRETIPEVVEPEHVAEEADNFIKKSFFRKVSHLSDKFSGNQPVDSNSGNIFSKQPRVVTLKDVGVEPVVAN